MYIDLGIVVEEGVFVRSIEPSSAAAVDDNVIVGDRLLSVSFLAFVNTFSLLICVVP